MNEQFRHIQRVAEGFFNARNFETRAYSKVGVVPLYIPHHVDGIPTSDFPKAPLVLLVRQTRQNRETLEVRETLEFIGGHTERKDRNVYKTAEREAREEGGLFSWQFNLLASPIASGTHGSKSAIFFLAEVPEFIPVKELVDRQKLNKDEQQLTLEWHNPRDLRKRADYPRDQEKIWDDVLTVVESKIALLDAIYKQHTAQLKAAA